MVEPRQGFVYDGKPPQNAWTKAYTYQAYPGTHHKIIDELYTAASDLVREHTIIPGNLPRTGLQLLRKQHSLTLVSTFKDRLAIKGHPIFINQMSLGVITYVPSLTRLKASAGAVIKNEHTQGTPIPRNLLHQPPETWPTWKVEDFELNCCPYQYSVNRVGFKTQARAIAEWPKNSEFEVKDIRFSKLREMLENAGLIDNASQADLTYQAENDRTMGIKNDNDLQLAVGWHCRHGKEWMEIKIMTQDDWG